MRSSILALFLAAGLGVQSAHAQLVNCSCLATQTVLMTNACQAVIPDLCQFTNCFQSSMVQPPPFMCSQTPAAGTTVAPGNYAITVTVSANGQVSQCTVKFTVNPPAGGCGFSLICATNKTVECGTSWSFDPPTWT